MASVYRCERSLIERTLDDLKADGFVASDAYFQYDAPQRLRREVAYGDYDFRMRLGRVVEAETARSVLAWLKQKGIVAEGAAYDEAAFDELRKAVRGQFVIPFTAISPVMERLLYMLSSLKRPRRVIGLGTYGAYALAFAIGSSCGPAREYEAEKVYAVDIDAEITEVARENLGKLAHTDHVECLAEDGLAAVDRLPGPFDYVYLDVESRELGKGLYLELLKKLYAKVADGGWVLAHDTVVPPFARQLAGYLAFVRDKEHFRESISFDVDAYGLELSIK